MSDNNLYNVLFFSVHLQRSGFRATRGSIGSHSEYILTHSPTLDITCKGPGSVHFFQQISKSEQCANFCSPTHSSRKSEQTKEKFRRLPNFIVITPNMCITIICYTLVFRKTFIYQEKPIFMTNGFLNPNIHLAISHPPTHPNPNFVEKNGCSLILFENHIGLRFSKLKSTFGTHTDRQTSPNGSG